MKVLVTGGAGFIGSATCRALEAAGHEAAVYDDFSTGHDWAVRRGARVFRGDIRDRAAVQGALKESGAEAVLHFAAKAVVPESVSDPGLYWDVNVTGSASVLLAMRAAGVNRIVFSSTAAVYGEPERVPIPEDAPRRPVNPYGRTKAVFEDMLEDFRAAHGTAYACLRYFNACGAAPEWGLGEVRSPETHLLPLVIRAALGGPQLTVCGTDYATRDGTCVRDYVDVRDLADAHVRALERLAPGKGGAWNLGTEKGVTVREIVSSVERALGREVPRKDGPRRPGDPPSLVASRGKAKAELGWEPRRSLEESIRGVAEFMKSREGR